jgi:cell division protein FtsQ
LTAPTVERPTEEAAAIDPRFRARRVAVRRHEGRRRLRRLIAIGTVLGLLVVGFLVTRSPLLDVDRVVVRGNAHTSVGQVLQTSGIRSHQPMTDVNLNRARRQLESLPWVQSVSVAKQWPSTIAIELRERTAIAAVPAAHGGSALVDRTGRVLEVAAALPPDVVVLAGLSDPGSPGSTLDETAADALHVAGALSPQLAPHVATVARTAGGVELWLRNAGKVRLGTADDLGAKLLAASTVLGQVDLKDLCAIDVRVPSAPSLTRAGSCL